MPAPYTDFLNQVVGGVLVPWQSVWVRLVSNNTATAYVSTAATTALGKFTLTTIPGDVYTVFTGPSNVGAWTGTGDTSYVVPYAAGDNVALGSATALASSPYASNLPGASSIPTPAGVVTGKVFDYGGLIWNTKAANALLDGVTNDAPAFTTTFAATPAAGGMVATGQGTSLVSASVVPGKNNSQISGAGRDASIIKLANAANVNVLDDLGQTAFSVFSLTVDGNKANQTTGGIGVAFQGPRGTLFNTRITNAWSKGVYVANNDVLIAFNDIESNGKTTSIDGSQAAIWIGGPSTNRFRVIGNRSDSSNDHGISLSNVSTDMGVTVANIIRNPNGIGIAGGTGGTRLSIGLNAISGSVAGHGIDLGGVLDTAVVGNVLFNNAGGLSSDSGARQLWVGNSVRQSVGTGAAFGFGLGAGASFGGPIAYLGWNTYLVVGNQFTQHNQQGMYFDSVRGEGVLVGNITKNNGQQALAGTQMGILLTGSNQSSGNYLVLGNKSYDDQNVKTQLYGLQINATAYHVFAIHNDLRGNKTGAVNDLGVATYTHGNLGYNPRGFLTAPAPAATGVILYNPFNCDCVVYINGTGAAALTAIAIGGVAAPVNATHLANATGGTLATASYWYRVSALNPQGETLASAETSIAVTGPTGAAVVRWTAVPGATGYNVYGRTTGAELKMVANVQATHWLDDGSVTPLGALPGGDTTGNTALTGVAAAPAANALLVVHVPWGNGIKVTYTTFVTANWQWQNAA